MEGIDPTSLRRTICHYGGIWLGGQIFRMIITLRRTADVHHATMSYTSDEQPTHPGGGLETRLIADVWLKL
jgi:hypothetical protein